jgi:uncharacterized protein (DUF302 family)
MRTVVGTAFLAGLLACAGCGGGRVQTECPEPSEKEVEVDLTVTLDGVTDMESAVARVTEALEAQGFGVISDMDVEKTMQDKLGREMRPYRILGACNPALAFRALELNPTAGLLLPCKAVVRQSEDGGFAVSLGRPTAFFALLGDPETDALAEEVEQKIRAVADAL